MGERDWTGELEGFLRDRFARLCATVGQPSPFSGLRFSPPLGIEESKYFLLGLETGVFDLNDESSVLSELLPSGDTEHPHLVCRLFRYDPPFPRLFRETVCQLSIASLLVLKRGWLKSHIRIEPGVEEYGSEVRGTHIVVRRASGELLACVEVKRSAAELQKLVTDLRTCCNRGAHAQQDCGFPQNHPKYEFCALYKPVYFWGVAPDADICLRMRYDRALIEMEQLTSLPPRSLIE